nr:putative NAD(P)-binding domain-containing protein [Tanacetum cinerariifolium]
MIALGTCEDLIRESRIQCTIVMPSALTKEPAGADLIFEQGDNIMYDVIHPTGKFSISNESNGLVTQPEGQTATGKEISNLFMAGSLPKTVMTSFLHDNDITRLQALVDKKKVVITEAAIREVLRLDDAEGVDCLHNEEIFVDLDRMGYEKLPTMLTFYKAFFSS